MANDIRLSGQCQYENKNVSAFLECILLLLRERMASEEGFPMYLKFKCPSGRVREGGRASSERGWRMWIVKYRSLLG